MVFFERHLDKIMIAIAFVVMTAIALPIYNIANGIKAGENTIKRASDGAHQTFSSMAVSGPVIALLDTNLESVSSIRLEVIKAPWGTPVDLSSLKIKYTDPQQVFDLPESALSKEWVVGYPGAVLESGERVRIQLDLTGLRSRLVPGGRFTIEIGPADGPSLRVARKTPKIYARVLVLD